MVKKAATCFLALCAVGVLSLAGCGGTAGTAGISGKSATASASSHPPTGALPAITAAGSITRPNVEIIDENDGAMSVGIAHYGQTFHFTESGYETYIKVSRESATLTHITVANMTKKTIPVKEVQVSGTLAMFDPNFIYPTSGAFNPVAIAAGKSQTWTATWPSSFPLSASIQVIAVLNSGDASAVMNLSDVVFVTDENVTAQQFADNQCPFAVILAIDGAQVVDADSTCGWGDPGTPTTESPSTGLDMSPAILPGS